MSTTVDAAYIRGRLSAVWPALIFAVLFGWLDWITHRDAAFLVVIGVLAVGFLLFGPVLIAGMNLTSSLARIPWWVRPFLFALPAYIYLLSRGQGTTDAGPPIMVTGILVVVALLFVGPAIDVRLASFYLVRNRILPRPLRIILSPIIAILLSFLIVHGDLTSLPAFWGGSTQTRKKAIETSTSLFVLAALMSTVVTLLLLREVQTRRLNLSAAVRQPGAPPRPAGRPEERVLVHGAAIHAWAAPDSRTPPVATVAPHTALVVAERAGAWTRVRASNGWTGWVDGTALVAAPGTGPMDTLHAAVPAPAVPVAERLHVPPSGTLAWPAPDPASTPTVRLDPGLEVEVVERHGPWARVRASNGWAGWVDGRVLGRAPGGGNP